MVKNPADARGTGSTPGSGRSPGIEMATHSSTLAWKIPWTEEPGGLKSMGSQSQTCQWVKVHGVTESESEHPRSSAYKSYVHTIL